MEGRRKTAKNHDFDDALHLQKFQNDFGLGTESGNALISPQN